jgi:hypothetical protein
VQQINNGRLECRPTTTFTGALSLMGHFIETRKSALTNLTEALSKMGLNYTLSNPSTLNQIVTITSGHGLHMDFRFDEKGNFLCCEVKLEAQQ